MSVVIAACAALGLLLLYDGLTGVPRPGHSGWRQGLDRIVQEAGVKSLDATRLLALSVGCAITSGLLVAGISSSGLIAAVFAIGGGWLPLAYVRTRRARRQRLFRAAWPDAIQGLISAVRAGISLAEACAARDACGGQHGHQLQSTHSQTPLVELESHPNAKRRWGQP